MPQKLFVAAALVCEKVLQEKDDVPSIIRIVDTFTVTVPPDLPADAKSGIQITGFLAFKKASLSTEPEKHHVAIRVRSPSGKEGPLQRVDLLLKAEPFAGTNVTLNMSHPIGEFGLFWIDVFLDDEEEPITQIPFRLLEAPHIPIH